MNRKSVGALLLAIGLVAAACAGGTPATPSPESTPAATPTMAPVPTAAAANSVTGSLLLPDGTSLPPGSSVVVHILDEAGGVVAEHVIPASEAGASPIGFTIEYDPGAIVADDPYVVGAQVNDEAGNLIFTAFEPVAVITADNLVEGVSLALVAVGA